MLTLEFFYSNFMKKKTAILIAGELKKNTLKKHKKWET